MERKSHISEVYQGYIYQLYAQYFCLTEMGYQVEKLKLYSMDDNKVYEIPLPNEQTTKEFEAFLDQYQHFFPADISFIPNAEKCTNCIYHELCDSSLA
jgi:CRISPR-associated protein Cas4